jgi:TetR/AcrR family acrAB operon transcriptional repressor
MARKTAAEAAKTRKRILEAAGEVFSRDGIYKTTLAQVAQQAGVTRGAIYWHFNGRQDLLHALLHEQAHPLEHPLPKEIDLDSAWQLLRDTLTESVSGDTPRKLSEIMLYQNGNMSNAAEVHQRLTHIKEFFMHQLQLLLTQAVHKGELAPELNITAFKAFFQSCISGVLYECLQDTVNKTQVLSLAMETLLFLAKSPPPHLRRPEAGNPEKELQAGLLHVPVPKVVGAD